MPGTRKSVSSWCEDVLDTAHERSEARRQRPQAWVVRKLMVPIVLALFGYCIYVYVAVLCVPAVRRHPGAALSRGVAAFFLAVFAILSVMFLWSYLAVVLTPPGFAADHVAKSTAPVRPPMPQRWHTDSEHSAPQDMPAKPADAHMNGAPIAAIHGGLIVHRGTSMNGAATGAGAKYQHLSRHPPSHPVLAEEYRYCYKEGFIKPMRAHHCRACGKCVLLYDHHCPWIGQCVGAGNIKFFFNFLHWCSLFTIWTFAVLLGAVLRQRKTTIEPQFVIMIALCALFALLTTVLLASNLRLFLVNSTTVESATQQRMREQERAALGAIPCFHVRARRAVRARWNAEWGQLDTEGNIWWLGSARENWEARMGAQPWKWFLPLGGPAGAGLAYPVNPRFDAEGRWRRREEWPAELR